MRKRNILFIDQYASIGGGQTVLLEMIESCVANDWSVSLLAPLSGELGKTVAVRFPDQIQCFSLYEMKMNSGKKTLRDVFELIKGFCSVIRRGRLLSKSETIYVNGGRFFPIVYFISFFIDCDFFYHIHLDYTTKQKMLISKISRSKRTKAIAVNSKFVLSRMRLVANLNIQKAVLLRYGLSKKLSTLRYRAPQFSIPGIFNFVTVGRIAKEKGQDLICQIATTFPQHRFYLIGDHDFQDPSYLHNIRLSAPSNVILIGKSTDVQQTVIDLNAHFSIVPSQWEEPFGLVAIESMALSLVTILSARGGLKEIACETGSVTFETIAELEESISRLTSLVIQEHIKQAQTCYTNAQRVFSWSSFSQAFQNMLCGASAN